MEKVLFRSLKEEEGCKRGISNPFHKIQIKVVKLKALAAIVQREINPLINVY